MNKMKFLLVCSAAFAAGISLAGSVDFDNLRLTQADSFATPETNVETSGATYTDSKYTLEGELDGDPALVVTPSVSKQTIEKFTLNFNVGFAEELPTSYENAVMGFAFSNATTAVYWNGGKWNEIALNPSVEEEASVTVLVEYDGRESTKKARFTIDGKRYDNWYTVGEIEANTIKAFGSGTVASISGTTHTIDKEIVPVTPSDADGEVDIEFTPTQIAALEAAGVDFSEPTALNTVQNNGQTKLTNYILFGKAKDAEITAADMPKAVGEPIASAANKVAVKVSGLNVQTVTGTQVRYVLMGSETGAENSWHQIDNAQTQTADTLEFPNDTHDRYFKVKAVIEYTTPAND